MKIFVCMCICSFDFLWLLQDGLVETLRRTRLKFVHCFLPHHNAALGESARSGTLKSNSSLTGSNMSDDLLINVPLLRSQVSNRSHLIYGCCIISPQSVANHQKFKSPGMWHCHGMSSSQSLEDSSAFDLRVKHCKKDWNIRNYSSNCTLSHRRRFCVFSVAVVRTSNLSLFIALPVYICKQKCFYNSVLLILWLSQRLSSVNPCKSNEVRKQVTYEVQWNWQKEDKPLEYIY